jgi:hypothetical protein
VGDDIKVNVGSDVATGNFKYISKENGTVFNLLNEEAVLKKEYALHVFTITKIYSVRSSKTDMFVKNAPRTVYVVFDISKGNRMRAAIEAALQEKEVMPN